MNRGERKGARRSRYTYAVGERGARVTVYERAAGGILYARCWDRSLSGGRGGWRCVSLGHRDQKAARKYARDTAAKLEVGERMVTPRLTVGAILDVYLVHRSPRKSETEQKSDKRRATLWSRVLGRDSNPLDLSREQWETFIDSRGAGAIDALGEPVAVAAREPVRARSVEQDLLWLRWAFNWAMSHKVNGQYLLRENPTRGLEVPHEKNPRRPFVTDDRFTAIRAASDRVLMEVRRAGKAYRQRSYLSELLDLAQGTGRRLRAVRSLKYDDLRLERTTSAPEGAIRWPADTDKQGRETAAPISPRVRAAIDRVLAERPGIGPVFLFPSPTKPAQPVSKERSSKWLRQAEQLAGLEKQDGSLWHAYRRSWATARKHLSDVDVAAAGGWKSTETLRRCYQQPDEASVLRVVLEPAALRQRPA